MNHLFVLAPPLRKVKKKLWVKAAHQLKIRVLLWIPADQKATGVIPFGYQDLFLQESSYFIFCSTIQLKV